MSKNDERPRNKHYRTFISPVFYKNPPHGENPPIEPIKDPDEKMQQLCWFDKLLGGKGLFIPKDLRPGEPRGRSLIMLLTGDAGTGKSTFALELCCRMAKNARESQGSAVNALYISAEESTTRLLEKVKSFGWSSDEDPESQIVFPCKKEDSENSKKYPLSSVLINSFQGKDFKAVSAIWKDISGRWEGFSEKHASNFDEEVICSSACEKPHFEIIVLDSLNVISPSNNQNKTQIFDDLCKAICNPLKRENQPFIKNPALVIVVLNASEETEHSKYWEFVSDIVFRFGWDDEIQYSMRTFEIMKIRDQKHAWGKQRLKIYPGPPKSSGGKGLSAEFSPYLETGGVFIFPSTHWHLSYLRLLNSQKGENSSPPTGVFKAPHDIGKLNKQISSNDEFAGFPKVGCTALIGERGTMKSHLAYLFLLHHLEEGKNCLLVSLRDNKKGTETILNQIIEDQEWNNINLEKKIQEDRLEIIHNEVGCISPEEFFHRIYVAVHRPRPKDPEDKSTNTKIVVINGLDRLEPRFPLIARDVMFVPALIQMLRSNDLCVVIVSSTEMTSSKEGINYFGLRPMADLHLRFERYDRKEQPLTSSLEKDSKDFEKKVLESPQISLVETVRVHAGQIGGKLGLMYRVKQGDPDEWSPKVGYCLVKPDYNIKKPDDS